MNNQNGELKSATSEVAVSGGKSRANKIITPVLCLLGAVVIWLYVMANDSPDYERTFYSVPVSLAGVSDMESATGMSVVSGQGHVVDVTISGKKSDVVKLTDSDISAYVNLGELSVADSFPLDVSVAVPSGFSVSRISPDNVIVSVDKTSSLMVPVTAKLSSYILDSEHVIGDPVPDIDEISVSGPVSVLNTIDRAEVELDDLGQITGTVCAVGTLELVDANGNAVTNQYLKMTQKTVSVTVPVSVYKDLPVEVTYKYGYYNADNVQIQLTPETIRVKGEDSVISGMKSYEIEIDEKKITGDTTVSESVTLPEGVENVDKIETITSEIKHIGTVVREFTDVKNITVINASGLNYEIITESVDVKLRGSEDQLSKITSENIRLTADLSNLSSKSGKVSLPVTVNINAVALNTVYEIGSYKIEVEIK